MHSHPADLSFPACCRCCPYRSADCTHPQRRTLVATLDTERPCPVYSEQKTEAMRRLGDARE